MIINRGRLISTYLLFFIIVIIFIKVVVILIILCVVVARTVTSIVVLSVFILTFCFLGRAGTMEPLYHLNQYYITLSSQYYCDYINQSHASRYYSMRGGRCSNDNYCGTFYSGLSTPDTNNSWYYGSCLSFKPI